MKEKVVNLSAFIITISYVLFAVSGYWLIEIAIQSWETGRQISMPSMFWLFAMIAGGIGLIIMYIGIILPLKKEGK